MRNLVPASILLLFACSCSSRNVSERRLFFSDDVRCQKSMFYSCEDVYNKTGFIYYNFGYYKLSSLFPYANDFKTPNNGIIILNKLQNRVRIDLDLHKSKQHNDFKPKSLFFLRSSKREEALKRTKFLSLGLVRVNNLIHHSQSFWTDLEKRNLAWKNPVLNPFVNYTPHDSEQVVKYSEYIKDNFGEDFLMDPWGRRIILEVKGKMFYVTSLGEDGIVNTTDDVASSSVFQ